MTLTSIFPVKRPFFRWTWLSQYQNISILDFIAVTMMEVVSDDNWSCKTRKAPVKLSPPTNQHLDFYRPDALPVV